MDLLLVLLLFASATLSHSSSDTAPWDHPWLPRNLSPFHYNLFIHPHILEGAFDGRVSIQMNVSSETNTIVVHADGLNISSSTVFVNETTSMMITSKFAYPLYKYWVVNTDKLMKPGDTVKLDLKFRGRLNFLEGIARTNFINEATRETTPMVVTLFRPNYARRAFPNFDEPLFKSRFTIILRHWANLTAVSNTPEYRVTDIDTDWRETAFRQTPNISSFAVGFVLSQHVFRNNTLPDGRPHRVWSIPERVDQVSYALNVTYIVQGYLNRELGNISSLKKIDQVAIPYSFHREGQAQWGLINHDEGRLAFNATLLGDKHRQSTLAILAIELARNYFGHLVSCQQWNHVWLDSGLSRFYALKAASAVEPVTFEEQELREKGLYDDAFNKSRPLVTPRLNTTKQPDVNNPLFLSKGAALVKMMENLIGTREFRRGIRRYMYSYAFKTVKTPDLFGSLQGVAGASTNITEIMNTWVYSMGYPVINIQLLADNKINATQKRFLMDPLADPNSPSSTHGYKWYVPLNYRTKGGQTGRVWLNKTDAVFENLLTADDNWVLFNYNQSGFYRVNYEATLWNNIASQLETDHTVFTDLQRSQLLSDALTLAQAEQLGFDVALTLTLYASKERSLLPWTQIYNALETIHLMIANTDDFAHFKKYVLNLTTSAMNELTVSDEGTLEQKLLRRKIMSLSCSAGHSGCIEGTNQLFNAWIEDDTLNAIPINIRHIVYCNGIASSTDESVWNTTFTRFFATTQDSIDVAALQIGLACTKNLTLLDKFTTACLSIHPFSYLELLKVTRKFSTNPAANGHLWEWLKTNHTDIDNSIFSGASGHIAQEVTYNFNTRAQLQEVLDFYAGLNATAAVERPKRLAVERINANIRWMEILYPTVSEWLQRNFPV